ncbi:protein MEMO1 isoform X3 [Aquila chrysaetos chrysaetos]|uniref:protein MEMO1 isoform X3 n=1 Tax=Aquila chrysaetos chrysaetos TaxID=223781 RepID=UPI001B7D426B|nr:protein MEMO1 isoform X3 [Aquila chrysaetos chrysaetos]
MVTRRINDLLASLLRPAAILSNDEIVCASVHRARNSKCVFGCAINELPGLGGCNFPSVTSNITGPQLNAQLEGWLSQVQSTKRPARAIIAPHAGYTYCGSCAAHAYKQVDPNITRKIFILGPSHHVPLSRCALSSVDIYRTPLYDLRIDQKIYGELWKTGMFERMSLQTDEDEHSIEMHLPYTAKAMESHKDEFTIIPVLVGALSESKEQEFGKLFSKYLADPSNLFVVSSDFCHWGYEHYRAARSCIF